MKRKTGLPAMLVFIVGTMPMMFAQDLPIQPGPVLPSGILGPQLIVWSDVQKPQPLPQPSRLVWQPEQQREQPANPPVQRLQPAPQTFTGTIEEDGSLYVLKVSGSSAYELDDQDAAKHYQGERARVVGTLDTERGSIHIVSIEVIS
jgi:hypothetical protein